MRIPLRRLTQGSAQGTVLKLTMPLSLWGGLDVETGTIIDATHPQVGVSAAGRLLAMTGARGSSSSSSALVEAARRRAAPAAILLGSLDPVLVIGSLVAADLYGVYVPVLVIAEEYWSELHDGAQAQIDEGATELSQI